MTARIKRYRLWVLLAAGLFPAAALLYAFNNVGDSELGQIDFTHSTINFVRGSSLDVTASPAPGVAVDSANGCVYVADTGNNRVLGWQNETSFANGAAANIIIGQRDQWSRTANAGGLSNNSLDTPTGVAADSAGNLYISDNGNNRVVEYDDPCNPNLVPPYNANLIFNVGDPWGLATDSQENLFVADRNNNRVLEYNAPLNPSSPEPGAGDTFFDNVLGQTTGTTCNQGGPAPTAFTLCGPYGVGTDGTDAYVADTGNNRVVKFVPISNGVFASNPSATRVLGQSAFNLATSGCAATTTSSSLCRPSDVAVDSAHNVYASDTGNSRITGYKLSTATQGQAASILLGQPAGTQNSPNLGGPVAPNTLSSPAGVAVDQTGNIFVLDNQNSRLLQFAANPVNGASAASELGQIDFAHNTVDFVNGSSLSNPSAVAVDRLGSPQHLYVIDADNNRVLGYNDATSFTNGAAADLVIGQPDFYTNSCNGSGGSLAQPPSASSLCLETAATGLPLGGGIAVDGSGNLWVSDFGNGRILEFPTPFASFPSGPIAGESATLVLGQADFTDSTAPSGCAAASATGLCAPAGLAFDSGGDLYVADSGNNRVLEYATPGSSGATAPQAANLVFGQGSAGNNFTGSSCNISGTGTAPSADTLCGPMGVALDKNNNLYVADYTNNRLLEYIHPLIGAPGTPGTPGSGGDETADLVFGQDPVGVAFTTATCNSGGISATTLCQPSGVAVDSFNSVFAADQNNSRVLVYTQSGAPPTNVMASYQFGQGPPGTGNFNVGVANSGGRSAASLALASATGQQDGIAVDSIGNLYAVDGGNVRVMSYSGPFLHAATPTPTVAPTPTPTATATSTPSPSPTPKPSPTPTTSVSANPSKLSFGDVEATLVGKTKTLSLANKGSIPAYFGQLSASAFFALSNDTCSNATVQPGQNCVVDITFTPPTVASMSQSLVIAYNGASPPETLIGDGVAVLLSAPKTVKLPGVQAGAIGKSATVTISNKSQVSVLMGTPVALTNSTITQDMCAGKALAPPNSCAVTVELAPPAGSSGKLTDSLSYPYTYGANQGRVTVALSGTAGAVLSAPASKTLPGAPAGSIGKPVNITITNLSNDSVVIGTAGALNNSAIAQDGCTGQTLAKKGAKCTVSVEFAPPLGTSGTLTDSLTYTYSYSTFSGVQLTVGLSGKVAKAKKS
jgi:sugar lactone lactonase YvrE